MDWVGSYITKRIPNDRIAKETGPHCDRRNRRGVTAFPLCATCYMLGLSLEAEAVHKPCYIGTVYWKSVLVKCNFMCASHDASQYPLLPTQETTRYMLRAYLQSARPKAQGRPSSSLRVASPSHRWCKSAWIPRRDYPQTYPQASENRFGRRRKWAQYQTQVHTSCNSERFQEN